MAEFGILVGAMIALAVVIDHFRVFPLSGQVLALTVVRWDSARDVVYVRRRVRG